MLKHLRARNLGVLEDAEIDPGEGFTVITGETGAGKTLLLGALRLLTGDKPRPDAVGPFGDDTQADGLFEDGPEELGVSRVVPRDGRSRAYLEGALVSAGALETRVGRLVEIVGQHDQLRLRRPAAVLELIDNVLDEEGVGARSTYEHCWKAYRALLEDQASLGGDLMALERELDLVSHQAREIEGAGLQPGDDEDAEMMASRLRNAEAIRSQLGYALDKAETMADLSGEVVSSLRKIADMDPGLSVAAEGWEGVADQIAELHRSVRDAAEDAREDPAALAEVEDRLTALGDLKRKYGKTIKEVIEFGAGARDRADQLAALLERASLIDTEVARAFDDLQQAAVGMRVARGRAVAGIEEEVADHLQALGMPTATVEFAIEPIEPGPSGADRVVLRFASDDRLQSGAIQDVASGGELSRLVLALRLATRSEGAQTLVFDEVDSGVGGVTALALGKKLSDLGRSNQVLCVTHLPQVAAHAGRHYVVKRDGDRARVVEVDGEDRLEELSRMLAGLPESARGREAAAELLELTLQN
ncbi:MAG TPA: AAA family ATPase [Acidimicrobiia bacterium]